MYNDKKRNSHNNKKIYEGLKLDYYVTGCEGYSADVSCANMSSMITYTYKNN